MFFFCFTLHTHTHTQQSLCFRLSFIHSSVDINQSWLKTVVINLCTLFACLLTPVATDIVCVRVTEVESFSMAMCNFEMSLCGLKFNFTQVCPYWWFSVYMYCWCFTLKASHLHANERLYLWGSCMKSNVCPYFSRALLWVIRVEKWSEKSRLTRASTTLLTLGWDLSFS